MLRQKRTDKKTNVVTNYTYDVINRLTKADDPATTPVEFEYMYDGNSNLTQKTLSGAVTNYTYNAGDDELATPYTFDANGNLTHDATGRDYHYNPLNQTDSITPSGGSAVSMTYADVDSIKRVTKGQMRFAYNEVGLSEQTDNGSGNPHTTYFIRDPEGLLVEEWDRDPSNAVRPKYYLLDGLQSVIGTVDGPGTITRFDYEPYGKRLASSGPADPFQFASGYYDPEFDLMKFGTRYYDADVGRWIQQDPVRGTLPDPKTQNLYAYVGCDPVNYTDPGGAFSAPPIIIFPWLRDEKTTETVVAGFTGCAVGFYKAPELSPLTPKPATAIAGCVIGGLSAALLGTNFLDPG